MVRRDGNIVTFRGGLYGGEAWTQATWLPSWARPTIPQTVITQYGESGNGTAAVMVYGNGAMNLGGPVGSRQTCQWNVT